MKTNPDQKTYIRKKFAAMTCKRDLLVLLNEAQGMMYGEKGRHFRLKDLTYYANPDLCKKRYSTFIIAKKNGGERTINAPVKGLRIILRSLNFILQAISEPHAAATGFVPDRSIVDNARAHVGKHYVYNLDIKDFFHSFDRNRVKMGFMRKPFNLKANENKEKLAFFLSCLCTHPFEVEGEMKTVLPQGSPTSPTITNILCKNLDRRLNGLAKKYNLSFTRYADDITFSSSHNIFKDEEFQKELQRIIEEDQQLVINPTKTRLQKTCYRQEATGLIVNEKVNVKRDYVKQLRMWLYYWEKYGEVRAEQIFQRNYNLDKGHVKPEHPGMANVIAGKLEFLKMVKGDEDPTYKKLRERFLKLHPGSPFVEKLLQTWETRGIDEAIKIHTLRIKTSKVILNTNMYTL
ncbi:RNA-directed DNA polymerase [Antarcticibacterium arcticum]|uniref:RNA-directed DNA polymerase n=1 Tax=Antarcticibacterium arcticum TaxID=2585771 RepID=A0A5B8YI44_9FLAO|nr:reverse transcriptase family protein [Antarcticibacterium arcticum]QED36698.1 RNA-directed DNA polymerase [Antarcticibacterium arcticum]